MTRAVADADGPHPIDCHVGARVRLRRTLVGMSQERLGARLGVTFQQIQKYEKGTNRISASRLWQIGSILGVPVAFFYEGAADILASDADGFGESGQSPITGVPQNADSLQLMRYFNVIREPRLRRAVLDLARSLANSANGSAISEPPASDS